MPASRNGNIDADSSSLSLRLTRSYTFGEKSMEAVPILEKWLSGDDEVSRVSAAGHILMVDPSRSDDMMPELMRALASENTAIQRQARWLLDELTPSAGNAVTG